MQINRLLCLLSYAALEGYLHYEHDRATFFIGDFSKMKSLLPHLYPVKTKSGVEQDITALSLAY